MSKRLNLTGKTFGRLTVIRRSEISTKDKKTKWECLCSCGTHKTIIGASLINGRSKSCGCYQKEMRPTINTTHGMTTSSEYRTYRNLLERCLNPKNNVYHHYGGRGIVVCDRWLHSFESFISDMGKKPSARHSIDRIDNNGNYEPSNCRWATKIEQLKNRRNAIFLTDGATTETLVFWSAKLSIPYNTIYGWVKAGKLHNIGLTQINNYKSQKSAQIS